jgi:hypothetical protein
MRRTRIPEQAGVDDGKQWAVTGFVRLETRPHHRWKMILQQRSIED